MSVEIKIDVSQGERAANVLKSGLRRDDLVETQGAVKAGTQAMQETWMKYISGVSVTYSGGEFTIRRVSGQYASAVQNGLRYPYEGDILKGAVTVDLDYADKLERGFGEFDIKVGLLASPKAKTSVDPKTGKVSRYIDIPFRHNTDDIPKSILSVAKSGDRALGTIRLGKGLNKEQYGIRSKTTAPRVFGEPSYTWRTGLLAGLVRKNVDSNNRGQYMTFRRVSANSDPGSWIHPGVEPKPVTRAIEENLGPKLKKMLEDAFETDVLRMARTAGIYE